MIAKTAASGGSDLLPEILAFTSSLELDRRLLKEDLVGSLAHLAMLRRQRIIPEDAALALQAELARLFREAPPLPPEEDVHMAVEAVLTRALGERAGLLHTSRSRNDQVALDLRLHVREVCRVALQKLAACVDTLAERAQAELETLLPAYTHRQRAQPVSAGYLLCGWGAMLLRDVEALQFTLTQLDRSPLGVGAISGTSLPIDRAFVARVLGFSRPSANGLDTVGDRDFALDLSYATARCLTHLGRIANDLIDFSSSEFGFVELGGAIACGSSMMPQKRNPDVFELIRGKTGKAFGNLAALFTTLKGLATGYQRDLQEDRAPLLDTGELLISVLTILPVALANIRFRPDRCLAALERDFTQATDLAEGLVQRGVPFRVAYQAVGRLVRACQKRGYTFKDVPPEVALEIHSGLDAALLQAAADVAQCVARKVSEGGTAPGRVREQIAELKAGAAAAKAKAASLPSLDALFEAVQSA